MSGALLDSPVPARTLAAACGLPLGAYRRDHVQSCVVRALRRERAADVAALVERVDSDGTYARSSDRVILYDDAGRVATIIVDTFADTRGAGGCRISGLVIPAE